MRRRLSRAAVGAVGWSLDNPGFAREPHAVPEIRVETLRREYRGRDRLRVVALDALTLTVAAGELLVVVGPSGSGKSTFLRLIAGLDQPEAGAVWIDGRRVTDLPPSERGVALVMQDHPLFPHLDVAGNLSLVATLSGVSVAETVARVQRVAQVMGLEALLRRRPQELSGGERQRVGLGGALVSGAPVLLLDEPLAQLDAGTRARMRSEIRRVQREFGATIIHVTHDPSEAMALADRLAVLRGGKLEQWGGPLEVYGDPANTFVAGFLGAPGMNLLAGQLRSEGTSRWFTLEGGGELALREAECDGVPEATRMWLGLRPERLRVVPPESSRGRARVEALEVLGHETQSLLRLGPCDVWARTTASTVWARGDVVGLEFDGTALRWFDGVSGRRWSG